MRFKIENMTCGGCARSVTRAIQKVDPGAEVAIDVEARLVEVRSAKAAGEVARALDAVGFPAVEAA